MNAFLGAAILVTLLAAALVVVPLYRRSRGDAPLTAVLTALAFPALAALLYASITSYPWVTGPVTAEPGAAPAPLLADTPEVVALRQQLQSAPEDVAGWRSLGDALMAQERYADARDAYLRAMELGAGGNSADRLSFAESSILADRNALAGEAGQILDEVLQREPANPKALWYGGMAALARGDAQLARQRWGRLLELSPPPQVREIIEQQLSRLDAAGPAVPTPAAAGDGVRIPVRINVTPQLATRIRPGASLFLIARAPDGAGPPLAVVRRPAAGLPMDVEISDADSMVPGRSLSGQPEIRLTARIANDGEAMAASGDVYGEASWRPDLATNSPLPILMDQVVN